MTKRFNTIETLRVMLAHPDIMFDSIQTMDDLNSRFIRETDFIRRIRDYMTNLSDEDRNRVQVAFKTNNLLRNQVIADIAKHDGERLLVFQDEVLNLFRLCEASLHQELTDSRLKSHLDSLRSVCIRLESASFSDLDPDYTEQRDDLLKQLSDLLGVLRKNVSSIESLNQQLEKISAKASYNEQHFARFRQEMFNNISQVYERHIKPVLAFLNDKARLSDGPNLFKVLHEVQSLFERRNHPNIADQIFLFSMSFTSVYKPMSRISAEVERFLRKTRQGILESNAMESSYQLLLSKYEETTTSNMRKKFIAKSYAQESGYVVGLKRRPRPQTYRFSDSKSYLDNFFSEIELRLDDMTRLKSILPESGLYQREGNADERMRRAKLLFQFIDGMRFRPTQDLLAAMHQRLISGFGEYEIHDLLSSLIRISQRFQGKDSELIINTTNRRRYLQLDDKAFYYRVRMLSRTIQHE